MPRKGKYSAENPKMGKRLVITRESLKLKQKEFAEILGVTPSMLSRYEKGRLPPMEILKAISTSGKVNLHWLLTGEGGPDRPCEPPPELGRDGDYPPEFARFDPEQAALLAEAGADYRRLAPSKPTSEELKEMEALQGVLWALEADERRAVLYEACRRLRRQMFRNKTEESGSP